MTEPTPGTAHNAEPSRAVIGQGLRDKWRHNVGLHLFSQLPSTSVWLREFACELSETDVAVSTDNRPDAWLCATDWQTTGVGRRGKVWATKPGNITFSLLSFSTKPASELLGLSLVTGIAVASCVAQQCHVKPRLKWPNDVILNDAKLGGLLTEINSQRAGHLAGQTQILTGIGLNVRHDDEVSGVGIGATSLQSAGFMADSLWRDQMIAKLAATVLGAHEQFFEQGWSAFADQWSTLDWLAGRDILIHKENSTERAVARGVNHEGALLVDQDGITAPLYSGDFSVRPVSPRA